jgi:hypothetical protein
LLDAADNALVPHLILDKRDQAGLRPLIEKGLDVCVE